MDDAAARERYRVPSHAPISIAAADLADPRFAAFVQDHLADIGPTAPPESQHALDASALGDPRVRVWWAIDGDEVVGTVALSPIDGRHEELKSMRTEPTRRRSGIGAALVQFVIEDARTRGISRISLETGSMDFFAPARRLYERFGFTACAPFAGYRADPHSVFMTVGLPPRG